MAILMSVRGARGGELYNIWRCGKVKELDGDADADDENDDYEYKAVANVEMERK